MRLLDIQSPIQRIELYRDHRSGLVLLLDGRAQFYEDVEHRYHECLCVVPALYCHAHRVFVGGGGDGLAAARLLKIRGVESIVVCDYDEMVTRLACEQEDLVALNQGSLKDERAKVVNADAYAYLERSAELFDLIVCDFPDPLAAELNRVYSEEFYSVARDHLADEGVIVVQTRAVPVCARIIGATLRAVFGRSLFYRFSRHGFTLSSRQPLERIGQVPSWTRFLNDDLVDALFVLPKDEAGQYSPEGAPVNRREGLGLVKEAMVDAYEPWVAHPFAYHPDFLVVELARETAEQFSDRLSILLTGLEEKKRLVLLVDQGVDEDIRAEVRRAGYASIGQELTQIVCELGPSILQFVRQLAAEFDDGSVADIRDQVCRPADCEEIASHLARLADEQGKRRFGIPESRCNLDSRATFVVTRDAEGRLVTLFRLEQLTERYAVEAIPVSGSTRAQELSILLLLAHLLQSGVDTLVVRDPDPPTVALLNRLGGCRSILFEVYHRF